MYYKITNQNCEVYLKLKALRDEEKKMEESNRKAIESKTGLDWEKYLGNAGQQNFNRVTVYQGFVFLEPDKVCGKTWIKHSTHPEVFIPNKRTKKGREMNNFLSNGLEGHFFKVVYDNLGIEMPSGKFTFPFIDVCGSVIVLYLKNIELNDDNIIEITTKEFNELLSKRND